MNELFNELKEDIKSAYETSVTIEEAERLAAKFLHAQLLVSEELTKVDLDARMKKSGVKAIRAAVYLNTAKSSDKKPSDVYIEAVINQDQTVQETQELLDTAEVSRQELQNLLDIFKDGHIYFRAIGRGRFE